MLGKNPKKNFRNVDAHNIMANVEIKLSEKQQEAFNYMLDNYHTAIGY